MVTSIAVVDTPIFEESTSLWRSSTQTLGLDLLMENAENVRKELGHMVGTILSPLNNVTLKKLACICKKYVVFKIFVFKFIYLY